MIPVKIQTNLPRPSREALSRAIRESIESGGTIADVEAEVKRLFASTDPETVKRAERIAREELRPRRRRT